MKKILLISLAALAAFVSCQKEISDDNTTATAPQIVTASIDQGDTKVTVDIGTTKAKVNWDADDTITVTDKNGKLGMYEVESGAGTPRATFKLMEEWKEEGFGVAPFTAQYGSDFSVTYCEQSYSATAGATKYLYMTAPASNNADFSFTAKYGLLKLNLKNADHKVSRVILSGADAVLTASITAGTPVDISGGVDFYIALPPGKYTKMEVKSGEWIRAVKTINFEIAANQVRSAKSADLEFEDVGPLTGTFQVNAEGKKVSFSPGNLYWDVDREKWGFEAYQCDYSSWNDGATSPCCKNGIYYDTIYKDKYNTIGHFYWTTKATEAYAETAPSSSISFDDRFFADDPSVMGPDWVTLPQSEWNYIFNGRINAAEKRGFGSIKLPDGIQRVFGIILIPDSFSDPKCESAHGGDKSFKASRDSKYSWTSNVYSFADWNTYMEPAGAVFLPMTFWRFGGLVNTGKYLDDCWYGFYWTGSTYSETDAYAAEFSTSLLESDKNICGVHNEAHQKAFSVRLVRKVD